MSLTQRLEAVCEARKQRNQLRTLRARSSAPATCDLASNDYFGMSRHPAVIAAAQEALAKWGCSASASPLITGYTQAHATLCDALSQWYGMPHGLIWNSGYAANHAVLSRLPQRGDLILADRLIHNSMIRGILASGARLIRYNHLDLADLARHLEAEAGQWQNCFVVTESVFSMSGDYPDLAQLAALKQRHGFIWIVDEAHATGCFGETGSGLTEQYGVTSEVDVLVGTLGKALGSMGAYTLFHERVFCDYLCNHSGEFIYSTYLPPACAAAAETAMGWLQKAHTQRAHLLKLASRLTRTLATASLGLQDDLPDPACATAIIPIILGDEGKTLLAAEELEAAGWRVGAVRPPTVPEGQARLRVSLNATLSEADLSRFESALMEVVS